MWRDIPSHRIPSSPSTIACPCPTSTLPDRAVGLGCEMSTTLTSQTRERERERQEKTRVAQLRWYVLCPSRMRVGNRRTHPSPRWCISVDEGPAGTCQPTPSQRLSRRLISAPTPQRPRLSRHGRLACCNGDLLPRLRQAYPTSRCTTGHWQGWDELLPCMYVRAGTGRVVGQPFDVVEGGLDGPRFRRQGRSVSSRYDPAPGEVSQCCLMLYTSIVRLHVPTREIGQWECTTMLTSMFNA